MCQKYLILKKDNDFKDHKVLDTQTFERLKCAANTLEDFKTLLFLCNSYIKAKEDFLAYDFAQFHVREVDMFNMFLNALEAMATNRNLWEAYLKRNYKTDTEIYPAITDEKPKSCFGLRDSAYYDSHIEYVVSKVLRNMIAHHSKPYSEMVYDDNYSRSFIVTKEDLLNLGKPNKSARNHIESNQYDYYDVVNVIKKAFEITDEINTYMLNLLVQKGWHRFISARYTIREYLGVDWQGAYLVWENFKYPENHLLRLSQIDISKHAMNVICSIAAQSLHP